MQKWEYKTIVRVRGWEAFEKDKAFHWAGDWNFDFIEELETLGNEGWELVAVSPRSGVLGGSWYQSVSHDYAGFTNEELWVFKRPKP